MVNTTKQLNGGLMNKNIKILILLFLCLAFTIINSSYLKAEEDPADDSIFKGELIIGTIAKIFPAENKVAIKSRTGEITTLIVDKDETIIWVDDDEKEIEDIKEGSEAEAKYRTNNQKQHIASWIDLVTKDELITPEKQNAEDKEDENEKPTTPNTPSEPKDSEIAVKKTETPEKKPEQVTAETEKKEDKQEIPNPEKK